MAIYTYGTSSIEFRTFVSWSNGIEFDTNVELSQVLVDALPVDEAPYSVSEIYNTKWFYGNIEGGQGGKVALTGSSPYQVQPVQRIVVKNINFGTYPLLEVLAIPDESTWRFDSWRTEPFGGGDEISTFNPLLLTSDNHQDVVDLYAYFAWIPSNTPAPSPSVTPSITPTRTPSVTPSPTPSISTTPSTTPSATPSISLSNTPGVSPSNTPSISVSSTPSISISNTPSATPSITPSTTPSATPSISVSNTPSISVSNTPSITPSPSVTPSITPSTSPHTVINYYGYSVISEQDAFNDTSTGTLYYYAGSHWTDENHTILAAEGYYLIIRRENWESSEYLQVIL